jgi:hypothetical protein
VNPLPSAILNLTLTVEFKPDMMGDAQIRVVHEPRVVVARSILFSKVR